MVPETPSPLISPAPHRDFGKVVPPDPTPEAIEEVARRICRAQALDPNAEVLDENGWYMPRWRKFHDVALAGIIAAAFVQYG